MINLVGENFAREIVPRAKSAEFFCIIADETTDVGHEEQLSVIIRYVYNRKVEEKLLSIENFDDTRHCLIPLATNCVEID